MLKTDLQILINILCGKRCDSSAIDWYAVLGFLELNRLAGRFYRVAIEQELVIPAQVLKQVKRTAEFQAERNRQFGIWLQEISSALEPISVPYAILKGNALVHADFNARGGNNYVRSLYDMSERTSNDIDLLVLPKDVGKIEKALTGCGFTQGYFNDSSNTVRPTSRREVMERRMNRGETVPFQRLLDSMQLRHVEIDINFSLDYLPSGMRTVIDSMMSRTECYAARDGKYLRSLEKVDFLVHLILHQYKEMREYSMVMRGKDLDMYKLMDIYLMLPMVNHSELYYRVKEYGIEEQTAVVLKAMCDIFGKVELGEELEEMVNDVALCAEFVVDPTKKNKPYVWTANPIERLLCFPHTGMLVETT